MTHTTNLIVVLAAILAGCASKAESRPDADASYSGDGREAVAPRDSDSAPKAAADAAPEEVAPESQPTVDGVEELLTQPSQFDYSQVDQCLRTSDYDRIEILNSDYLVFYDYSGRTWVNKIKKTCPGLRPRVMLHLGVRKRRICAEGMFEGVNQFAGQFNSVTGTCFLGVFHRVSKDQVQALKTTLGVK